jgi:hypothetical protein
MGASAHTVRSIGADSLSSVKLVRKADSFTSEGPLKDRVVMLFRNRAQEGELRNPGIREDNIELALLPLDLGEEAIQIGKVRHAEVQLTEALNFCS